MSVENFSVSYMFQGIFLMYPYTIGYFPTNRRPFKEAIRAKHFSALQMILATEKRREELSHDKTGKGGGVGGG